MVWDHEDYLDGTHYDIFDDNHKDTDTIRLRQDNHLKIYVDIPKKDIEFVISNVTNWRTPTKKYTTFLERFNALGSTKRDRYIAALMNMGY